MDSIGIAGEVLDYSEAVDRRNDHTGDISLGKLSLHVVLASMPVHHRQVSKLDPTVFGICLDGPDNVREQGPGHQHPGFLTGAGKGHPHSLGCGGRSVVHRGVADIQPGQCTDHALVLEDIPQGTL